MRARKGDHIGNSNAILCGHGRQLGSYRLESSVLDACILLSGQEDRAVATTSVALSFVPSTAIVEDSADGRSCVICALSVGSYEHRRQLL
jgi:hypothetical protein